MSTSAKQKTTETPKAKGALARLLDIHDVDETFSCLFYGPPGTGKSTLASTFPQPILVLEAKDKGTTSMKHLPKGAAKVLRLESWEDVEEMYWFLNKGGHGYKSVILENIAGFQDLAREHLYGDGKITKQGWGEISGLLKTWFLNFRDLEGIYTVYNAHHRVTGRPDDEDNDVDDQIDPEVGPAIMPSVGKALCGWVSVVGQTFIRQTEKQKDGEVKKIMQFRLRIGPHPYYITKVRTPKGYKVPGSILDPSFAKLQKISKGEDLKNG